MPTLLNLIAYVIYIIDVYLVPLVFALAFIAFLFGIFRAFIGNGGDAKKAAEGRQYALWAVIGFAIMVSVWGLVHLLVNTVPFGSLSRPMIPKFNEQTQQQGPNYFEPNTPSVGDACRTNDDCGTVLACIQGTCVDVI